MPIQIWTQDQAPQLRLAGAQSLAQGIAGAGQSIGSAIEKYQEKKKKEQDELKRVVLAAKGADSFFKALPEARRPMSPEKWALLAPADRAATMTGLIQAQGFEQRDAELGEMVAKRKAIEEAAANSSRFKDFAAEMGRYNEPGRLPYNIPPAEFERFALPEGQTQPGPTQLFQALQRSGFNPGNETDSLLRALNAAQESGAGNGGPIEYDEDPVSGQRFARHRNTVLNSGINPDKLKPETQSVTLSDGTVVDVLVNAKTGGSKQLKGAAEIKPFKHPTTGAVVPDVFLIDGKPLDLRSEITKKVGGPAETAPASEFKTVEEARKAGKKKGDRIQLWDAKQNRYRPFELD